MLIEQLGSFIQIPARAFLDLGLSKKRDISLVFLYHTNKWIPRTLSFASCFSSFLTSTRDALWATHAMHSYHLIASRSGSSCMRAGARQKSNSTHFPLLMLSRSTPSPRPIVVDTAPTLLRSTTLSSFINLGRVLFRARAASCSESRSRS